ncbi:Crp/Fnr family transcriptional regulator [Methylobacterium sp. A54F]
MVQPIARGGGKIDRLMGSFTRSLPPGATLIAEDSDHRFVYRLRSGWAGRLRYLPDGRSQFILIFLPGDLFAVKSLFVTHHPDAVIALSAITVSQVDQAALREAYDRDADIAAACTWQVVEEERRLHRWVTGLGRGSAEERMALLLIDFRARLVRSGVLAPSANTYELPMTQEQLGDHLGITSVHVNRVLKVLRENGLVVLRGREVTLPDPAALARIASPLLDTHERTDPAITGVGLDQETLRSGDAGTKGSPRE